MKTYSNTDQNIALLTKVLDLRAEKEKVIASNIANSETPGFSPARFRFEDELRNAISQGDFTLQTTHRSHLPLAPISLENVRGHIVIEKDATGIGDKNSVSLDQEMIALSENELLYETAAQLLKKKLGIRKYVISGGQ